MTPIEKMQQRADGIRDWIADNAPYCSVDQKHLDEHSPERAYWHYGYQAALNDAIKLLSGDSKPEPKP